VVENWNSANSFIHYGKGGEIATNRLDDQEVAVLCLALVQNALVLINTLMIQRVLAAPAWLARLTPEDLRGLTPLIYAHVNPYGVFRLDMAGTVKLSLLGGDGDPKVGNDRRRRDQIQPVQALTTARTGPAWGGFVQSKLNVTVPSGLPNTHDSRTDMPTLSRREERANGDSARPSAFRISAARLRFSSTTP